MYWTRILALTSAVIFSCSCSTVKPARVVPIPGHVSSAASVVPVVADAAGDADSVDLSISSASRVSSKLPNLLKPLKDLIFSSDDVEAQKAYQELAESHKALQEALAAAKRVSTSLKLKLANLSEQAALKEEEVNKLRSRGDELSQIISSSVEDNAELEAENARLEGASESLRKFRNRTLIALTILTLIIIGYVYTARFRIF